MVAGQTTLSITDLPFAYSLINIIFILWTGEIQIDRLYVVGMIAGLIGTFLITVHPIQRGLDRLWKKNLSFQTKYLVKYADNVVPPEKRYKIDITNLRLALSTAALKYEKDKIASGLYFVTILTAISYAFNRTDFLKIVQIEIFGVAYFAIEIGLWFMIMIVIYIIYNNALDFNLKLKLTALYFDLMKRFGSSVRDELNIAKNSIDLSDWTTTKQLIDRILILKYADWINAKD